MELRELIEKGIDETGSSVALAKNLGLFPQDLSAAKAGRRGLPIAACFQLAELIHEDAKTVIAASELVTEKKPERRAILAPFARHAAVVTLTAVVTLLLSPPTANAAPILKDAASQLVLCQLRRRIKQLAARLATFVFPPDRSPV